MSESGSESDPLPPPKGSVLPPPSNPPPEKNALTRSSDRKRAIIAGLFKQDPNNVKTTTEKPTEVDTKEEENENVKSKKKEKKKSKKNKKSPLPKGWEEYADDDGVPYYHNESLGQTVWERPTEDSTPSDNNTNNSKNDDDDDDDDDDDKDKPKEINETIEKETTKPIVKETSLLSADALNDIDDLINKATPKQTKPIESKEEKKTLSVSSLQEIDDMLSNVMTPNETEIKDKTKSSLHDSNNEPVASSPLRQSSSMTDIVENKTKSDNNNNSNEDDEDHSPRPLAYTRANSTRTRSAILLALGVHAADNVDDGSPLGVDVDDVLGGAAVTHALDDADRRVRRYAHDEAQSMRVLLSDESLPPAAREALLGRAELALDFFDALQADLATARSEHAAFERRVTAMQSTYQARLGTSSVTASPVRHPPATSAPPVPQPPPVDQPIRKPSVPPLPVAQPPALPSALLLEMAQASSPRLGRAAGTPLTSPRTRHLAAAVASQRAGTSDTKGNLDHSLDALPIDLQPIVQRLYDGLLASLDVAPLGLQPALLPPVLTAAGRTDALRSLTLAFVPLNDTALRALASYVVGAPMLASLDVEQCAVRDKGTMVFSSALVDGAGRNGIGLRRVNFAANRIGDSGALALAKACAAMPRLSWLCAAYCNIGYTGTSALADMIGQHKALACVDLSHNRVGDKGAAVLAKKLLLSTTLEVLLLASNRLGDHACRDLGAALANDACSLRRLDLAHNDKIQPSAAAKLADGAGRSRIHTLRLTGATLKAAGGRALGACVLAKRRDGEALTTLDLAGCQLGDSGIAALCGQLESASPAHLAVLSLRGNAIGYEGATALAKWLASSGADALRSLNVAGNQLSARGAHAIMTPLLATAPLLSDLDLSGNALGDAGIAALGGVLRRGIIERLRLAVNDIGPRGAAQIARFLTSASDAPSTSGKSSGGASTAQLAVLDLSYNRLGATGVQQLAPCLDPNQCSTLRELSLEGNSLLDDGAKQLARALANTVTRSSTGSLLAGAVQTAPDGLRALNIGQNGMRAPGAAAVASLLRDGSLCEVDLKNNNIGDDGAQSLAGIIKVTKRMRQLDLRKIGLSARGTAAICEAIQLNPVLTYCDLRENEIHDLSLTALYDAMSRNVEFTFLISSRVPQEANQS